MTLAALRTRVDYKLRDYSNITWEEADIDILLNEGYAEFNMLTHCLVKHTGKIISIDNSLFTVPSDNLVITRATWDDKPLEVRTTNEMDTWYEKGWRTTESTGLRTIIQDAEGYNKIRIYPILNDTNDIGHLVLGTDDSTVYKCILNHTSSSASEPTDGADYADYWTAYTSVADTWANGTAYDIGDTVTGDDDKDYKCILAHTSATATNKPITGSGYATYWEAIVGTWATATDYYKYLELELDYVYIPTDLSATTDVPAIPTQYHPAIAEYAISQAQQEEVQSQQSSGWSNIHWNKFMQYVRRCKREIGRGIIAGKSDRITPRVFI